MSITTYKKKRKFTATPEPAGKIRKATGKDLLFVVQKHNASRLHYDFRLEVDGVLKSWAVPKGPSMNPAEKRLAMAVEDHPYEYKDFEGVIPEGNYGAGQVIVWDKGNYMPESDARTRKEKEKEIRQGVKAGKLDIVLNGEKLKGAFVLIKTKGRQENAWLLFKKNDEYALKTDILKKGKSVLSGLSIKQVSAKKKASRKLQHPKIQSP